MSRDEDLSESLILKVGKWSLIILAALIAAAASVYFLLWTGLAGIRYVVILIWLIWIVLDLGIRYIKYVFDLPDYRSAVRWFFASLGFLDFSTLKVWDTNLKPNPLEKPNLIKTVGGPGRVTVLSRLVVLAESLDGSTRVLVQGEHDLGRLERVKEVIKLEDIRDEIDKKSVTTRDGITIDITGMSFIYRLLQSNGSLNDAVKLRVYNLAQDDKGETDWCRDVREIMSSVITNVVSENLVDYLTASGFSKSALGVVGVKSANLVQSGQSTIGRRKIDPRQNIQAKVEEKGKEKLRDIGADLVWYEIGHFELPSDINKQRAETWQKTWEGNLEILKARKAAARLRYRHAYDQGRAQAQADLLIKIVKRMDEIRASSSSPPDYPSMYIAGLTQLLDTLAKAVALDGGDKPAS